DGYRFGDRRLGDRRSRRRRFGGRRHRRRRRCRGRPEAKHLPALRTLKQLGGLDFLGREDVLASRIGTRELLGHNESSHGGTASFGAFFHYEVVPSKRKARKTAALARCVRER